MKDICIEKSKGLSFSSEEGSQIHKKSASIKLWPPYFGNKHFMTPHHRYTLPPKQAKIVLKSVFLNKINTLSVVILWLPTFWSSKILWTPYFSFQKIMIPQYIWDPPHSEENDSPLTSMKFLFIFLIFFFKALIYLGCIIVISVVVRII